MRRCGNARCVRLTRNGAEISGACGARMSCGCGLSPSLTMTDPHSHLSSRILLFSLMLGRLHLRVPFVDVLRLLGEQRRGGIEDVDARDVVALREAGHDLLPLGHLPEDVEVPGHPAVVEMGRRHRG